MHRINARGVSFLLVKYLGNYKLFLWYFDKEIIYISIEIVYSPIYHVIGVVMGYNYHVSNKHPFYGGVIKYIYFYRGRFIRCITVKYKIIKRKY